MPSGIDLLAEQNRAKLEVKAVSNDEDRIRAEAARVLNEVPAHELLEIVKKHGNPDIANEAEIIRIRGAMFNNLVESAKDSLDDQLSTYWYDMEGYKSWSEWEDDYSPEALDVAKREIALLKQLASDQNEIISQAARDLLSDLPTWARS